jgi:hypothetical protein
MFRTKKTMQQQWDDEIISYRDRSNDELATARRIARWSARVPWWELRLPLNRWEATCRAAAADATTDADRMVRDLDNPRNGGPGWPDPEPSQFSALDKAFILLRLGYLIALTGAVMAGVVLLAYQHDPHIADSLPRYLLVNVEALAAAAWALAVTSWAMTGALTAWGWVRGYVRGADE